MEEGWAVLASPEPLAPDELDDYARARGGLLFRYTARLLGGGEDGLEPAGEAWALVDLARHCADRRGFRHRPRRGARARPAAALAVAAAAARHAGRRSPPATRTGPAALGSARLSGADVAHAPASNYRILIALRKKLSTQPRFR